MHIFNYLLFLKTNPSQTLFMKKILFVPAFIIFTVSLASAQSSSRLGFSAGVVYANMSIKDILLVKENGEGKVGVTFGVLYDVPMMNNGSFQPALNFVQKGTKEIAIVGDTLNLRLNYIEIPLNVLFKFGHSSGNFMIGGGPAVALGISGKETRTSNGTTTNTDISSGDDVGDHYKGIDFGLNVQGGFEFSNGFFIAVNYTHGVNSLFADASPSGQLWNRCFGLRFGYLLGAKK